MSNETFLTLDEKFIAEKNDKGIWIYKANEILKQDKKVLKKKYHDLPRYKIVVQYENEFKKETDNFLIELTKDLVKKLKQI